MSAAGHQVLLSVNVSPSPTPASNPRSSTETHYGTIVASAFFACPVAGRLNSWDASPGRHLSGGTVCNAEKNISSLAGNM